MQPDRPTKESSAEFRYSEIDNAAPYVAYQLASQTESMIDSQTTYRMQPTLIASRHVTLAYRYSDRLVNKISPFQLEQTN